MMEKVALKVKVRLVLASRELSGVLIDIVTLKAQLHKTSIFLDIDDSIQNEEIRIFEFMRQNTHFFFKLFDFQARNSEISLFLTLNFSAKNL